MKDKGAIRLGIDALKEIQKSRGMTLEEAIENLTQQLKIYEEHLDYDDEDALKLGIEALKAIVRDESGGSTYIPRPLLGETESRERR